MLQINSIASFFQYVEDRDNVTWFPIQTLHVCAATKCTVQVRVLFAHLQLFAPWTF